MRTSEQIDKVSAALIKARSEMGAVTMTGHNSFDGYDYFKLTDFVKASELQLAQNSLHIIASAGKAELLPERKNAKDKPEYCVRVSMVVRIVHSSGQWIEVDAVGDGQDRMDKGVYKAQTGARKYALAHLFGLATANDADSDGFTPDGAKPQAPQRPVEPKSSITPAKSALMKAVAEWAGVQREDIPSAVAAIAMASKVAVSKPMTDDECRALSDWIAKQRHSGITFEKATTK